jgi:hypothetical protein
MLTRERSTSMGPQSTCVLMFAPLCYPPEGSEAIVTCKLVLAMIDAGWKMTVISQSDFGHFYPHSCNDHWQPLLSVLSSISGVRGNGMLASVFGSVLTDRHRALSWVVKATLAGLLALRKGNYDVVLSRAAPQYGHLPALFVSRLAGVPWIANWSDPMPPAKAPPPYGRGINAKVSRVTDAYCRSVFRWADWHTFPCERLMHYYWRMAPELETKSSVIPHIALSHFRMDAPQNARVFSLCHTGSMALRDPTVFFRGLRRFLDDTRPRGEVQVTFIGSSSSAVWVKAREFAVNHVVRVETPKTYEVTLALAASSSVVLVIEAPCGEGIFMPSKVADVVQTGRPVLAISPRVGTLADLLGELGGGIAVDNTSSDEVFGALSALYRAWEMGTLSEAFGSRRLFDHCCQERVMTAYSDVFGRSLMARGMPNGV